ncbi:MAG: ribbon-helix-helix domain-containing protein [Clostridia bacterium]
MGKTSSASKNKFNKKTYDIVTVVVKKGNKEIIQKKAKQENKSTSEFIRDIIEKEINKYT